MTRISFETPSLPFQLVSDPFCRQSLKLHAHFQAPQARLEAFILSSLRRDAFDYLTRPPSNRYPFARCLSSLVPQERVWAPPHWFASAE